MPRSTRTCCRRSEEAMARESVGSGKTGIDVLDKNDGGKRDGRMELGAMKAVNG
jgi:hypothetical protein